MAHQLAVLSPEKTIVTYQIAGLGVRFLAQLLDWLIIMVANYVVSTAFMVSFPEPYGQAGAAIFSTTAWILYFSLFQGFNNGQTIGKMATSIRVRMADGTPITMVAAFGRTFMILADFMPAMFMFGVIAMFSNPKGQRLGDLAANTIVVVERRSQPRFVATPHQDGIHPYEVAVGELRDMTLEEYQALRKLCDRFPELPTSVQDRLIREVYYPIARQRKIPEVPGVHPISLAEAAVMKVGRERGLL